MIECLECSYKGAPQPILTENTMQGCVEVCPNCKGINYDVYVGPQNFFATKNFIPTIATSYMELAKMNSNYEQ